MHKILSKVAWYWRWHWLSFVAAIAVSGVAVIFWYIARLPPAAPKQKQEQIIHLAEGKLIGYRCTGAWSHYDMELKFDDGSIILVSYPFCQENNIREGRSYKIWRSSVYGYCCKELTNGLSTNDF